MKKAITMLAILMSFSSFANINTVKEDIPEMVVYGVDLQSNILESKEKLKNDMVLSQDEMKEIFSSSYEIQAKRLEDYNFQVIQEKD
tara:strand:+ start:401 stop:661 length:261 start_codon:yes stop_codon:yes gene_type:complete